MKFLKPGSLSFSLAWKIILIQVTMVAMGLIGMVLMYGDSGAGYIDWKMSESIAKSIHVRDDALHVDWRALDQAARTLGETPGGMLRRVHLPLIRPALAAAALLVFVDCMKELPATLLLRPLNLETLATTLYAEAARGTYEEGAIAALIIVLAGLLPVILLARVGRVETG